MLENERGQPPSGPKEPVAETKPAGIEGTVPGNSVVAVTAPDAEKTAGQAKTAEQAPPPKKPEQLSAAEKLKLKEKAMAALNQLTKEADKVSSAPDYVAALGVIPGQADIKNGDRFRSAFRARLMYFHPDKANRKVAEILGDIGKVFPELADKAHVARLACEEATKMLATAENYLKDDGKRAKYLAEKYGIHAGAPEDQRSSANTGPEARQAQPRAERTNPGANKRQERPRAEQTGWTSQDQQAGQAPDWAREAQESQRNRSGEWRRIYDSDPWQEFARTWEERKPPVQTPEKSKPMGQRFESLVERIKEAQGQSRLAEMVQLGVEALKEVKDMVTLKHVLEIMLTYHDLLKTKYPLKENRGTLPTEIVMLALKGMLGRLKRPPDENDYWAAKKTPETKLKMTVDSIAILLSYLKPRKSFGMPFGAAA